MLVKGIFSFSSQTTDNKYDRETYLQTDIHASYQYFFIKNLFSGVELRYNAYIQDSYTSSSFSYGPKLGYAFGNKLSKVMPFLGIGWQYNNVVNFSYVERDRSIIYQVNGGLIFPVYSHLGICLDLDYQIQDIKGITINTFLIGVGLAGLIF